MVGLSLDLKERKIKNCLPLMINENHQASDSNKNSVSIKNHNHNSKSSSYLNINLNQCNGMPKKNTNSNCTKINDNLTGVERNWEKVLYKHQGVPDNYVPPTFLKDLRKNGK